MKVSVLNKLLLLINRSFTMKKLILLVILAFSMVLSPLATTIAATPKVINYQGQLESDAITSKAPVLVVFELFEDAAGGSALWIEQKSVTVDNNGFFSVYLGDVNPIDLKFDKQYFVQVTVGNNQPFPRTKLSSTPSAFYAADADTALYAFDAGMAMDVAPKAIGLDNLADEVLTAGGDLMGMYPNPQIKPSAIIDNIPDGSITSEMLSPNISTSPSGPAGGDLFGSYPDPLIAVGAVKTDRIFDGAVTEQKIADGAVTNNKIVSLDAAKLTNVPALNFQVAVMTDATIDGDGTNAMPLGLADDAVSTSKIVDGAVTNAKVGADAITTDKIMDGTIIAADIATGAVTTDEILDETILAADIATGAVTTSEILNETILAEDIATGAVTTSEILDETILATDIATGAVTTSEILNSTILTEDLSDNAVTQAKLADDAVRVRNIDVSGAGPVDGDVLYFDNGIGEMRWGQERVETSAPLTGDGSTATPVTLDPTFGSADELLIRTAPSGWVSSKINTNNIADGAVTSAKIADGTVMTVDLADGSVTNPKLAADAVTSNKILDGTVISDDLATNSVTTVKITDANVTTAKLADASVTTAKINDDAVTNIKIDDDAVTGNKVLNGSLSSLDLNTTGVVAGIYGDPNANPNQIDVAEFTVDAQGRITNAVENTYTVIGGGTIFNESPVSDITVDGTYDNLDLQIKPGVVGTTELADNSVTSPKIVDGTIATADLGDNSVNSVKIIDGSVTSADIADGTVANIDLAPNSVATGNIIDGTITNADLAANSVSTVNIIDNNVLNTKIGSGVQVAGKVLKADGAGNTVWGDDLGLTLPYTGSYDGPGDAFTLTHTGAAGAGSAAVFTSSTATNTSPAVSITKGVDAGAGSALVVSGTGVQGTNYIAKITNTNLAEGRTLLLENNAPVLAAQITDPNGVPNSGDEYVTPDPTGTDLNDATLVVRNNNAAVSNQKLAIKTYGSIQANSTIQGTNLVAHGGQITLLNPTTGAVAAIHPPTNVGDPLNITPALDINGTSTVLGINNIWESFDGNLFPAGTGTDRDVPTALAVSNSIGSIAAEPFITFQADGGGLTNNRVFAVNSTLTSTIAGADNGNIDLSINLANPNTWTGTQTLSAAGNGLVVTTNADFQGDVANSTGDLMVNDNINVSGTSTLQQTATIGGAALAAPAVVAENNDVTPTIVAINNGAGSSIDASGNVTINNGGLDVTGATNLNGATTVTGANTFTVGTGATNLGGTLTQTGGQVTFAGNVDANNGLDVTGAATVAGTVTQTGAGNQVSFAGNVDANNGLDVTGAATVAGTITQTGGANQVSFAGNVDAANGLDVTGGNFTLPVSGAGVDVNEIVTVINNANTNDQLPTALAAYTAINNVASAEFFTLSNNASLNNERALQFNAGNFTTVDGGANSNFTVDLSNTTVAAAAYGNNAGTSYSTFTVDAKGRLTAAATQAIVVNDDGLATTDIDITGANSSSLGLQIRTNAVGTNELATADYSGDLAAGNYVLGNLDNTAIGAANPSTGVFTNLTVQTDLTIDATTTAANTTVDDIYTTTDFTNDGGVTITSGNDTDLITAGAVASALAATDLQVAYNNGNTITTAGGNNIEFISGAGEVLDVQMNIENTATNLVTVDDNLTVTGTTTSTGLVTANGGLTVSGTVTLDNDEIGDAEVVNALTIDGGTVDNSPIGATTASTGAFTTLSASGLTTANGGLTVVGTVTLDNDEIGDAEVVDALTIDGGTIDNSVIGATTAAAGTFTALNATTATTTGLVTAGNGLTVSAGNFTLGGLGVDGIQNTIPLAADATDLVTENAVFLALQAHTLQTAYVNGNVITTSVGEGNVQIAGTEMLDIDVNTTLNGNLTQVGDLGVTGNSTLTGLLTQVGGGNQVTFAGNVDANNGLDVTGATNLTGTVAQSGGNVTLNGAVSATNGVAVQGGVNITTGSLNVAVGNGAIGGNFSVVGTSDLQGAVSNTTGALTIGDDLVVTGTSDLRGTVSNSLADLDINDGVDIDFTAAGQTVAINSSVSNSTLFTVGDNSGGAHSTVSISSNSTGSAATVTSTGGPALSVSSTAGTALNAGSPVATNTAVNAFNSSAANATVTLSNNNATSSSFALSTTNGHIKVSADGVINNPAAITVGSRTMIRMTGTSGAAPISAGTQIGQILILTNEDAATINVSGPNILGGAYVMPAESALQLVWNGAVWVRFQ